MKKDYYRDDQLNIADFIDIPALTKTNTIYCGDCFTILKQLPSGCVDTVITSPPYFQQREYNGIGIGRENGFENYLESLYEGFNEVVRVTKMTGNIFYNIGDKIDKVKGSMLIPYRFAIAVLEDHPELHLLNNITWLKKNPTPRQYNRRLVSATEPFFHFVRGDDYYYSLDEYMPNTEKPRKHKPTQKLGTSYFELIKQSDLTDYEKEEAIDSVTQVINEVKSGKIQGFRVKIRGIHAPAFGGQEGGRQTQMKKRGFTIIKLLGKPMKKDYIEMSVESPRNMKIKHPAVYPLKLIEELVKLSCPRDGLVLDPYCGSGTTLVAARNQDRQYIGIDISPEYCHLAEKRLETCHQ